MVCMAVSWPALVIYQHVVVLWTHSSAVPLCLVLHGAVFGQPKWPPFLRCSTDFNEIYNKGVKCSQIHVKSHDSNKKLPFFEMWSIFERVINSTKIIPKCHVVINMHCRRYITYRRDNIIVVCQLAKPIICCKLYYTFSRRISFKKTFFLMLWLHGRLW